MIRQLREEMMGYADEWKFEQAAEVKRRIDALETFIGKSVVVNPSLTDMDVFGMEEDDNCVYVSFLRVLDGAVVQAQTLEIDNRLETTREDALWTAILEIRERLGGLSPTLLVPFTPEIAPPLAPGYTVVYVFPKKVNVNGKAVDEIHISSVLGGRGVPSS